MSRRVIIAGIDNGFNLTGYCVGAGDVRPRAGAFRFDPCGDNLGLLGTAYRLTMRGLFEREEVTHVITESPLLVRSDKLINLRKRYGIDMILETLCAEMGIVCEEASFARLKKELSGNVDADKDAMVAMALKCGIGLPEKKVDGREDAADGFAGWLIGVRLHARQHLQRWDNLVYGRRGALL